jgi:chromosome transmission fidelity protein 1
LSQFVNELKRIDLPAAIPAVQEEIKKKDKLHEELKHLSLGARKNLCINSRVSSLKSATAINERCLELQDVKTPKEKKCPFVPNKENEGTVLDFQHHALAKIRDIEDLGSLGKKLGVCPYYATRPAVKPSEVRVIPNSPSFVGPQCGPNVESRLSHYHIHFYSKRRHEKH